MSLVRISGIILVVVGFICLGLGLSSSQALVEKVATATTGRFTQPTIWYIISGIAMVIGGGALWVGGRPKL